MSAEPNLTPDAKIAQGPPPRPEWLAAYVTGTKPLLSADELGQLAEWARTADPKKESDERTRKLIWQFRLDEGLPSLDVAWYGKHQTLAQYAASDPRLAALLGEDPRAEPDAARRKALDEWQAEVRRRLPADAAALAKWEAAATDRDDPFGIEGHKAAILARVLASAGYRDLQQRVFALRRQGTAITERQAVDLDFAFAKLVAAESALDETDGQPVYSYVHDLLISGEGLWEHRKGKLADPGYLAETVAAAIHATPRHREQQIEALSDTELEALPDPEWLIEGVLPADTGGLIYGRRSTLKSFVVLDWGLSIQTATPWLDHPVEQGQFIYIAAEGWGGLKKRVTAWKRAHGWESKPVKACFVKGAILRTDGAVERLIARIKDQVGEVPVRLIVLDTLNRLIPGIEENSPEAMGRAVGIVDRLRRAFPDASVLWVHHSGWDDAHERGHSSLGDDLDVVIHAEAGIQARTVDLTCEKQKDADEFEELHLSATYDETADSLTLTEASGPGTGPGAPLNPTDAALLAILERLSAATGGGYVTNSAWLGECVNAKVKVRKKVIERRTFNYARERLAQKRRIEGDVNAGFRPRGEEITGGNSGG